LQLLAQDFLRIFGMYRVIVDFSPIVNQI
jgi:hypothetical protein